MSQIIKRDSQSSLQDLIEATNQFVELLADQKEDEAMEMLSEASGQLSRPNDTELHLKAANTIVEAFDGEMDMKIYTLHKATDAWTKADQLAQSSQRVLSLALRLQKILSSGKA